MVIRSKKVQTKDLFYAEERPHFPTRNDVRSSPESSHGTPTPSYSTMNAVPITNKIKLYLANRSDSSLSVFHTYPGAERADFDFVHERYNYYTTNLIESTAHMVKGCLGIGLLCIHEAYMWGGLWTSMGITVVLGILAIHNTLILVSIAQQLYVQLRVPKMSYPDLIEAVVAIGPIWARSFSKCLRFLMELVLFVQILSSCNIYQIMMAHTFKRVLKSIGSWDLHLRTYILMVAVPIVFLCTIRKFKYLAYFSIVADIFILVCVLSALSYGRLENADITARLSWRSVQGCFKFCGILLYSIDGTILALPIENHMTHPVYFSTVVWFAIPIVLVCITTVGFLGYWRFGEKCRSPINLHMPIGEMYPTIMQFILTIVLAVTFAINFWVPFRIFWRYTGNKIKQKRSFWEMFTRILLVVIVTIFSLIFHNLMKFMSLMGNIFLSIITIIFPAFLDILYICRPRSTTLYILNKDIYEKIRICRDCVYICIGFTLMGGGLYAFYKI